MKSRAQRPKQLKVTRDKKNFDLYHVNIGDVKIGKVVREVTHRDADFTFTGQHPKVQFTVTKRTMAEIRDELAEKIDRETYMSILEKR